MINAETLKKIKLVVFDLDGTLLDNSGNIGNDSKKLVKRLNELGLIFTFATKRTYLSLKEYAEQLNIKAPVITLEGALIKTYPENKEIYKSIIKEKYVKKAINMVNKNLLNIALCHADQIFYDEYNSSIPELLNQYGSEFTEVTGYENYIYGTVEMVIIGNRKDTIRYIKDRMEFPYCFGLENNFMKSENKSNTYYLEIRKAGSSKGKGLKRITKFLNINIKHTVVMGDWYNDRSMFETNALKIALNNAVPEIKRMADKVMNRTNNEDGAAEFLEMLLKAKMN
jgi:Cof subfamily protein (haloacid dehalogenase superfamily)